MSNDDIASNQELANLEFSIQSIRSKANLESRYQYTGYCLNPKCFEEIARPKLFCDRFCAEEFERLKKSGNF